MTDVELVSNCIMATRIPVSVSEALSRRMQDGALRVVTPAQDGVDLCSNDYLGLARQLGHVCSTPAHGLARLGATGSRLVSGSTLAHEEVEHFLACFHATEAALLFGSGFEANIGLLGSLGGRGDTILYDELVHASMRDGVRLSIARSHSFRHNDVDDLRRKLQRATGDCFVAVESLYSMDGDCAPLQELCALCRESGAHLIVDEAHATGVYGHQGEGLVQANGLANEVFARVHTFGKALGYRGACVVGSRELRDYLINFARSFVYSTACDLFSLRCIREAYELMAEARRERLSLQHLIGAWAEMAAAYHNVQFLRSASPIQGIVVPGNDFVVRLERRLLEAGFFVRAIRSPTVPRGSERLRICLHSFNRVSELAELLSYVDQLQEMYRGACAAAG